MNDLKAIFEKKINSLGIKKQVDAAIIIKAFNQSLEEIFGKGTLNDIFAVSFRDGILKVHVKSSSQAQEIQGNWQKFVQEEDRIKKIVFKTG